MDMLSSIIIVLALTILGNANPTLVTEHIVARNATSTFIGTFAIDVGTNHESGNEVAWVDGRDQCSSVVIGPADQNFCHIPFSLNGVNGITVEGCGGPLWIDVNGTFFAPCESFSGGSSNCSTSADYRCISNSTSTTTTTSSIVTASTSTSSSAGSINPFAINIGSDHNTGDEVAWIKDQCSFVVIGPASQNFCHIPFSLNDVSGITVEGCGGRLWINVNGVFFADCEPSTGGSSDCSVSIAYQCIPDSTSGSTTSTSSVSSTIAITSSNPSITTSSSASSKSNPNSVTSSSTSTSTQLASGSGTSGGGGFPTNIPNSASVLRVPCRATLLILVSRLLYSIIS